MSICGHIRRWASILRTLVLTPLHFQINPIVHLDLQGNKFEGAIPDEWASLAYLEELKLAHCSGIKGTFPSALKGMREMKHLSLHSTNLEGTIPSFLGGLKKLGKFAIPFDDIFQYFDSECQTMLHRGT